MSTCEQRVDRGFAAVTSDLGASWVLKVSTSALDMDSVILCTLGQAYGSFGHGVIALRLFDGRFRANGNEVVDFHAVAEHGFMAMNERYETLRSAWVKKIRAAQKELEK